MSYGQESLNRSNPITYEKAFWATVCILWERHLGMQVLLSRLSCDPLCTTRVKFVASPKYPFLRTIRGLPFNVRHISLS